MSASFAAEKVTPPMAPQAALVQVVTPEPAWEAAPAARKAKKALSGAALTFSGWGWLTMGRVESSPYQRDNYDVNFEKEWLTDYDAGFKIVAPMPHRWSARLHLGMTTAYPILDPRKQNSEFTRRKLVFYMIDAAMEKTFKSGNSTYFFEAGFFPVKYNPQVMNLGEYLFRSGTYPQYLNSGFELADKEKLTGIHFSYKNQFSSSGWFKGDVFFTTGMRDAPVHNISPAVILATSPHSFLEVGAGIVFNNLIDVDKRKTTPWLDPNFYQEGKPSPEDSYASWIDTSMDTSLSVAERRVVYTFSGIKSETRLTLDPLSLAPEFKQSKIGKFLFSKDDLKLYGEFAVLGWKNYPGWYQNRWERIPIMAGINFPTFQPVAYTAIPFLLGYKLANGTDNFNLQRGLAYGLGGAVVGFGCLLLDHIFNIDTKADVLALEAEYYSYKYWNSADLVWRNRAPIPYIGQVYSFYNERGSTWYDKTDDDRKWSVYLSKKLFKCIRISGQVASDHNQRTLYMFGPPTSSKYTEICPRTVDWYWNARIMYYF